MATIEEALKRNRIWAARVKQTDTDYFERLAHQQEPEILWIGCSDSRVPANQILDLPPGEVFVHRNIANLVVPSDLNVLSVLQYAVEVLAVKVVIVCGHYGCGGVNASLSDADHGLIDNWLGHIREVSRLHQGTLEPLTADIRADRLCELNVIEQARHVAHTTIVRNAWQRGQRLSVHGLVYSLKDGVLEQLVEHQGPSSSRGGGD